ncbi:MAG TPA: VTT domain-containing protein [Candidatus Bathyarchaeia archaeon]|nr:VTT domain-containing protein [Candidatus Bathyarchaeia archaeon]
MQVGTTELALLYELLGVLMTSFMLNLIPFAGPSNLLIASNAAILVDSDPFTLGFLVALGSATAKFIHYIVTFFIGKHVSKERREHLDTVGLRFGRWSALVLFVVAATPLPDEPIIIPLGLLKYNPAKFFSVYFFGKLSITIIGAYLGQVGEGFFTSFVSQEVFIAISIVLTVIFTVVLLKVDLVKLSKRVLKRT